MATIKHIEVDSKNIWSYGYDPDTETLEVQFRTKGDNPGPGAIYQYRNVPPTIWAYFQAAESKGKFFHENIRKGGYGYTKISD